MIFWGLITNMQFIEKRLLLYNRGEGHHSGAEHKFVRNNGAEQAVCVWLWCSQHESRWLQHLGTDSTHLVDMFRSWLVMSIGPHSSLHFGIKWMQFSQIEPPPSLWFSLILIQMFLLWTVSFSNWGVWRTPSPFCLFASLISIFSHPQDPSSHPSSCFVFVILSILIFQLFCRISSINLLFPVLNSLFPIFSPSLICLTRVKVGLIEQHFLDEVKRPSDLRGLISLDKSEVLRGDLQNQLFVLLHIMATSLPSPSGAKCCQTNPVWLWKNINPENPSITSLVMPPLAQFNQSHVAPGF